MLAVAIGVRLGSPGPVIFAQRRYGLDGREFGPRPHAIAVNEQYRKLIHGYMVRHKVKPGITGWAQVNGGGDDLEHMKMRIRFDLEFLRTWSLALDLSIIFRTVGLVVRDSEAY